MDSLMNDSPSIADWIVGAEGRDFAAGPTRKAALRTARELGIKGGEARPASALEIDDIDLSDAALGIAPEDALWTDGGRWWAVVGDWVVRDHRARVGCSAARTGRKGRVAAASCVCITCLAVLSARSHVRPVRLEPEPCPRFSARSATPFCGSLRYLPDIRVPNTKRCMRNA